MDFSLPPSLRGRLTTREERGQCDFFTFRVKRENSVKNSFCLGKEESGDSLHLKEFHCKRDHPNSVGYLAARVVTAVLDLEGRF